LRSSIEAFLDEEGCASHWYVLPLGGEAIVPLKRSRAPDDAPSRRSGADAVDSQRIQLAVLRVGQWDRETQHTAQGCLEACGCLPGAALRIGPGDDPRHRARGDVRLQTVFPEGVRL